MRCLAAVKSKVKIPMTPKGVEHNLRVKPVMRVDRVKIPMTPKGVEHLLFHEPTPNISSEDSYDAERR